MNRLVPALLLVAFCFATTDCLARGGFSSSGGRGGFSSGRSFSSPGRSFSSPSRSYSAPRGVARTTTTTTTSRVSSGGRYYGGYGYHPMMYPGFGMGYGYSNGMLTGLIIGNMMHPQGTTVYQGSGVSQGSALLYPDGRVVDQNGYQVGTYIDGQFTPMQGGMVAQPAPADFRPPPQPVVIDASPSGWEIVGYVVLATILIVIILAIFL